MTRPAARLPDGPRISDLAALGVLTATVPAALIDAVLVATQPPEPAASAAASPLVVYYVMALALYAQASYGEVLRCLLEGVRWLRLGGLDAWAGEQVGDHPGADPAGGHADAGVVPAASPSPLRTPARRSAGTAVAGWSVWMARPSTCRIRRNWRPSSAALAPRAAPAASRKLRLVGLIETGTHAMFAVAVGRYDTSEVRLTPRVLQHLQPNMVCLADRAFVGFELWRLAVATGADLLWRVRLNQNCPATSAFPMALI